MDLTVAAPLAPLTGRPGAGPVQHLVRAVSHPYRGFKGAERLSSKWAKMGVRRPVPAPHPPTRSGLSRKGRNNTLVWPVPTTRAVRGPSVRARGGHTSHRPRSGHDRGFLSIFWVLSPASRHGDRPRLCAVQASPDHPWVHEHPRWISPTGPTAPSPTPRTPPRNTRTSIRSTSGRNVTADRAAGSGGGSARQSSITGSMPASGYFWSTTPTPNRLPSGRG